MISEAFVVCEVELAQIKQQLLSGQLRTFKQFQFLSDMTAFSTELQLDQFLSNRKKVMLIQHAASQYTLLQSYLVKSVRQLIERDSQSEISLFIDLQKIKQPLTHLLQEGLVQYGLTLLQAQMLLTAKPTFNLFLIGYEQLKLKKLTNLFITNQLENHSIKKVVITCDETFLVPFKGNYSLAFMSYQNKQARPDIYTEVNIVPKVIEQQEQKIETVGKEFWHNLLKKDKKMMPGVTPRPALQFFGKHPLNQRKLIDMPGELLARVVVLRNVSMSREAFQFKQLLFLFLYYSKFSETVKIGASNAITILNSAGVVFSDMDLSRVKIPYANLRNAIMDGTNLTGAQLQHVILADAFLKDANFAESDMEGGNFDQQPALPGHGDISAMAYHAERGWLFCATEIGIGVNGVQVVDVSPSAKGKVISYAARNACRTNEKITAVALSASGNLLVTLHGNTCSLLQVTKGSRLWVTTVEIECIKSLPAKDELKTIAIDNKEEWLAIGGFNKCWIYSILKQQRDISFLLNQQVFANSIAFSQDGQYLAIVTDMHNPRLFLYDRRTKQLSTLYTFKSGVDPTLPDLTCVRFSPDDKWIAVATTKGYVSLIEVSTKQEKKVNFNRHQECRAICFSPDNQFLFLATEGNASEIVGYSMAKSLITHQFSSHAKKAKIAGIHCLIREGFYEIRSADSAGFIRNWQISIISDFLLGNKQAIHHYDMYGVAIIPSTNSACIIGKHKITAENVLVILSDDKTSYKIVPLPLSAYSIAVHPTLPIVAIGGTVLSSARGEGVVHFYNWLQNAFLSSSELPAEVNVVALDFNQENLFVFRSSSSTFALYQIRVKEKQYHFNLLSSITIENEMICSLKFSPNNHYLAIGTDKRLIVRNFSQQRNVAHFEKRNSVLGLSFSKDSRYLVADASNVGSAFALYSVEENEVRLLRTFNYGHLDDVRCVAISSKHNLIVSSGKDGKLIIWRLPTTPEMCKCDASELKLYELAGYLTTCEYLQFDAQEEGLFTSDESTLMYWQLTTTPTCSLRLQWTSAKPTFFVKGANYENVKNLSEENKIVLSQNGAKHGGNHELTLRAGGKNHFMSF